MKPSALDNWNRRLEYFEQVFGKVHNVWRTQNRSVVLLECLALDGNRVLVTSGMSDKSMTVPQDSQVTARAELFMYIDTVAPEYIARLTNNALFPFFENTYFGHGDTINWNEPIVNGSQLVSDLIIYSIVESHRGHGFTIDGFDLGLYWIVPIASSELEYKKTYGIDALLAVFDHERHPLILDPYRFPYV